MYSFTRSFLSWLLIFFGIYIILGSAGLFYYFRLLGFLFDMVIPMLFLVTGIIYVTRAFINKSEIITGPGFYLIHQNKMVYGVAAGLSGYTGISLISMRLLWLLFIALTAGIGIIVYLILAYYGRNITLTEKNEN